MTERSINYPTGSPNGMSFICNRWTFTGPEGYRVVFVGGGGDGWGVLRYVGAHTRQVSRQPLTLDDAHALAARLSGRSVNVAAGKGKG